MIHLIDTYQNLVFSICYKITNNYFDAQDLTQDAFLSAYSNQTRFDGRNEKAWLCRIATNKCLDYKRKTSDRQMLVEDLFFEGMVDEHSGVEEHCLEAQVRERLLSYCKGLKPPYNEVAVDYFYEELGVEEIAEKYKRNVKTVQTQIYRAKAQLRKCYERSGRDEGK